MTSQDPEYDIIFAGGGATACVTASRLAKADPSLKILILEAGPHTRDKHDHIQLGRYFRNLARQAPTFSYHFSQPSSALGGRCTVVPTGRCLGGGSSVNFAMYTRASASDYDDWEKLYDNPGWGSSKLIPLLKKAETFQSQGNPNIHGTSGPIKVSYTPDRNNVGKQFLEAAAQYDKSRSFAEDTSDFHSCNVYGRWPVYVDHFTGRRSDVPHHYIYNQTFTNLEIITNRRVIRVVFDSENKRAIGVEHVDDTVGRAKGNPTTTTSHASRLVVLSAGAFGSPAILERSGIGGTKVLTDNCVTPIVDLPGVGENYMDHNLITPSYIASDDADTLDAIFRGEESDFKLDSDEWLKTGKGLLTHNGIDAAIRLRPTDDDLKMMPEFETRWETFFANSTDKPIMLMGSLASYTGPFQEAAGKRKHFNVSYFTGYPVSIGYVHIQSGDNAYAPLAFHPGYLDDVADVGVLRWAYKFSRELARRMKSYRGEFRLGHPDFPEGSEAVTGDSVGPADPTAPALRYSSEDDKAIDVFHRQSVATSWHSCGTCAMKPRKEGGVVDSRLNVYGVEGLKVADLSIMPSNVGANTYNTALAIGEKAAVIIAEDLGIQGVTEE